MPTAGPISCAINPFNGILCGARHSGDGTIAKLDDIAVALDTRWTAIDSGPRDQAIDQLHERCAVYTRNEAAERLLDRIGWRADADLSGAVLLEPAAGEGAFLVPAAHRLIRSLRAAGIDLTYDVLADRIQAWEIHPVAAAACRVRVVAALCEAGLDSDLASKLVEQWVCVGDFIAEHESAVRPTHVVGNPPYVRWSYVPAPLKTVYQRLLPPDAARGDLSLAFLHVCLELLIPGGRLGFVVSDRWLLMGYSDAFRTRIDPWVTLDHCVRLDETETFERRVDTYAVEMVLTKARGRRRKANQWTAWQDREAQAAYRLWLGRWPTLQAAGCEIRVGPALGIDAAFVLGPDEVDDVEAELLCRYVGPKELVGPDIDWKGRFVVRLWADDGTPIDPANYPRLLDRLERHREQLSQRAIVRGGSPWYRTIDRVRAADWQRPKLLIPEMTKAPRIVIEREGIIPSHGVYAIFAPDDDVDRLYRALSMGVLTTTLRAIAPRTKGGAMRCYKRILSRVPFVADYGLSQSSSR